LTWLGLLLGAQAQEPASTGAEGARAERDRIQADRAREQLRYEKEESVCYQRFAVNNCLREVRVRRRATFEELRRQEIILNDADRKKRAAEQVRSTDEKAASQAAAGQEAAQQRQAYEEKLERARQKKDDLSRNVREKGAQAPQAHASAPDAISPESREKARKAFEEKQLKAQERKAKRDKEQAEKAGPPPRPLPQDH
jgi:colicin import membrane protein